MFNLATSIAWITLLAIATPALGGTSPAVTPSSAAVRIESLPISTAALGEFPFIAWSAGFKPQSPPVEEELGHFYFWDDVGFHNIEGRTFLVTLIRSDNVGSFNEYLLKNTFHTQLQDVGGVKISSSRIPPRVIDLIPKTERESLGQGLGDVWNDPVETWVIRRQHYTIWFHYTDDSAGASIAVVAQPNL